MEELVKEKWVSRGRGSSCVDLVWCLLSLQMHAKKSSDDLVLTLDPVRLDHHFREVRDFT